ncbi:hypothetical protein C0993_009171 [Termitomyces sp. T159_Od127]|nr:hypothetical protein C0993_009171 [Termitomyces sp. T159_Od127]
MQFLQLDVRNKLPFEPESFDIIHARFIFMHLPNWQKVLENIISLLKPGGWLWIEEVDFWLYDDGPQGLGPSLKVFNKKCLSHSGLRNVDVFTASSLRPVLEGLGSFIEVHNIGMRCPTNGKNIDSNARQMGQVLWAAFRQALKQSKVLQWVADDITSELADEVIQEAEDPLRDVYLQMYMTWSQKK